MTEYISKQVKIEQPDHAIYQVLADFNNFTPILKDRVDGWDAGSDYCSFKVSGFQLKLKMVDREPCKTIKLTGDQIPFEFFFWIQMQGIAPDDTRLRITIHAELNPMLKMMLGKKLQDGVDTIAEQIVTAFNRKG